MIRESDILDFAVETSKAAGDILLRYFGTTLTKKIKTGPDDYATEADEAAENLILNRLSQQYPEDAVITEESGSHGPRQAEYTWIIDPLDGTHNFASGSKDFGVMICRAKGQELVLAVIWNLANKILAAAQTGSGIMLNGKFVQLKDYNYDDMPLSVERDNQDQLKEIGYPVTNLGASANTLITLAGERRAFVSSNGFIWDFAPPAFMLAEAGWVVTDFHGNPFLCTGKVEYGHPGVIAAQPELHQKLSNTMQQ